MPGFQKIRSWLLIILGILILLFLFYIGSLWFKYNQLVKLQEQKDAGYKQYLESQQRSPSPSSY